MKKLFLLARNFPYGISEPYLESEIVYYEKFDEVHIFSLSVEKNSKIREIVLQNNIQVHKIYFKHKFRYIINTLNVLLEKDFWQEVKKILKMGPKFIFSLVDLLIFMSRADIELREIEKIIAENCNGDDEITLYSYRFDYSSYIISKLNINKEVKKIKKISRAHGIDLYQFRHRNNYLPLRERIIEKLNHLVFISNEGKRYMTELFPKYENKYLLSYLGTHGVSKLNKLCKTNQIEIVSCSNVISIKRLPLIFNALNMLNIPIHWTHFGDGEDFEKLKDIVKAARGGLKITLRGRVSNMEILSAYANNHYDLFVNVSTTEGLPVSIMEAMSAGIPVIATDVGGTKEILIDNFNGYLVPKNLTPEELTNKMMTFIQLSDSNKEYLRYNARKTWEDKFDSAKNYKKFNELLIETT